MIPPSLKGAPFQVPWQDGTIAFPSESLARISCDFGTGGAGIALFIHRLLTQSAPSFMLDELLEPDEVQSRTGDGSFQIAKANLTPRATPQPGPGAAPSGSKSNS
jgi:hypothetical protein